MISTGVVLGLLELFHVAELVRQHRPDLYDAIAEAVRHDQVSDFDWASLALPTFPQLPDVPMVEPRLVGIEPEAVIMMARTIYGEARNQSWEGLVAVGWVIHNRVNKGGWWGDDIISVCTKPQQFSCWNKGDPSLQKLLHANPSSDTAFRQCLAAALAVVSEVESSPVGASCHYHSTKVRPAWAKGKSPKITIGDHVFYEGIA